MPLLQHQLCHVLTPQGRTRHPELLAPSLWLGNGVPTPHQCWEVLPGGTRGLPAPARSHHPTPCATALPSPGG